MPRRALKAFKAYKAAQARKKIADENGDWPDEGEEQTANAQHPSTVQHLSKIRGNRAQSCLIVF
jgi:hypothetical protein